MNDEQFTQILENIAEKAIPDGTSIWEKIEKTYQAENQKRLVWRVNRVSGLTIILVVALGSILLFGRLPAHDTEFGTTPDNPHLSVAQSIPGDFDPTFGSGGVATLKIGDAVIVYDLLVLADGSTLIGGTTVINNDGNNDFFLARFDNTGTLDPTFGNQGIVITDTGMKDYLNRIALDQNGNIVGVGSSHDNGVFVGVIVRYNANGMLDTTFDSDGKIVDGRVSSLSGLVIDASNRILASGRTETDAAVVRYDADGTSDTAFGVEGLVTTDYDNTLNWAGDLVLDANGSILVGGTLNQQTAQNSLHGTLTRYNADGSLDASFDSDGRAYSASGTIDSIYKLTIDGNGSIVAIGSSYTNAWNWSVARFNADGSQDMSFLPPVITDLLPYTGTSMVADMVIDGSGRVILAITTGFPSDMALVRLNPDGSADTTFSSDGVVVNDISAFHDRIAAVGLDANGNILAAGYAGTSNDESVVVAARYYTAPVEYVELLQNGSFELEGNWKVVGATSDRRVCYTEGKQAGKVHTGLCSFRFRGGAGENSSFVQTIILNQPTFGAGDQLSLSAYVAASGVPSLKVQAAVKYADMPAQRINIRMNNTTHNLFIPVGKTITLKGTPASIKVKLINTSLSGRIHIDDLRLVVTR